ncbi:MAG: T9SS type A sorting domain-containing protein [Agriterribacter sp.]
MNTVNFIKAGTADVDLTLPGSTSISCTRTSGSGTWYYNSSGKILTMNLSSGQSANFYMSGTGSCGATSRTVSFTVSSGGYGYLLSPNPANDYVTITAVKDENSPEGKMAKDEDLSYEVSVYNVNQALITKGRNTKGQKQVKLNIGGLAKGVYFVVIKNGDNLSSQQLIIK